MSVRVIGGKYGSILLKTPRGYVTHPMGDRPKSALFNSLVGQIEGAKVLDAFAGSGAIGFEALSRGAAHVTFVDRSPSAVSTIKHNIAKLRCENDVKLVKSGVSTWAKGCPDKYDLIFADPPYNDMQLSTVDVLFRLLKPKGLMVLSYPGRGEMPPAANGVVVVDNRSYGNAALVFYRLDT